MRNRHHRVSGSVHNIAVMDDGIVAPNSFQNKREQENQGCRDNRLDTELGTENPSADDEQGHIHADSIERDFPGPQGVKDVTQTIGSTRSHQVGVDEHHIANGKQCATDYEQQVGPNLAPQFSLLVNLNHKGYKCNYQLLFIRNLEC